MYLFVKILLVAGDRKAAPMDLSKMFTKKKSLGLGEVSSQVGSMGLNMSSGLGILHL